MAEIEEVLVASGDKVLSYPLEAPAPLDPPGEWARLRQHNPVREVRLASGDTAALVTRYEDVRMVLSDPRFNRPSDNKQAARVSDDESGGVFNSEMAATLPQTGEGHLVWRRTLNRWFTAKRINAMRPRMAEMADHLVGEMTTKGAPADLKQALAFPFPVWVICDLLGVPDADRDRFAQWSDTLLTMTRSSAQEVAAAQAAFLGYMSAHIKEKRANPGEDLLSELITGGDPMWTDKLLAATGQALLLAGHETTANMIGKMVAMLLADRTRWDRLVADPALVRTAVEESLRFDANAGLGMLRYVDEEIELSAGTKVPSGTTVLCSMAAANRDTAVFTGADEMDLSRSPNPHLSFGAGTHSCLGQALARTELQVSLEVLLRRLPSLELAVPAEELKRLEGLIVGGLQRVPVRW